MQKHKMKITLQSVQCYGFEFSFAFFLDKVSHSLSSGKNLSIDLFGFQFNMYDPAISNQNTLNGLCSLSFTLLMSFFLLFEPLVFKDNFSALNSWGYDAF